MVDLVESLKGVIDVIGLYTVNAVESAGLIGVTAAMALESACIPIPSEVVMPFAGYMAHLGKMDLFAVSLAGTLGCTIGSVATYLLGRYLKQAPLFGRIYRRLANSKDYRTGEEWLRKHGDQVAFTSRLLPVVRTFISLPAGVAGLNLARFTILTFTGSLIWCFVLTYVGYLLGKNWQSILEVFDKIHIYLLVALGLGLLYLALAKIRANMVHKRR